MQSHTQHVLLIGLMSPNKTGSTSIDQLGKREYELEKLTKFNKIGQSKANYVQCDVLMT